MIASHSLVLAGLLVVEGTAETGPASVTVHEDLVSTNSKVFLQ